MNCFSSVFILQSQIQVPVLKYQSLIDNKKASNQDLSQYFHDRFILVGCRSGKCRDELSGNSLLQESSCFEYNERTIPVPLHKIWVMIARVIPVISIFSIKNGRVIRLTRCAGRILEE